MQNRGGEAKPQTAPGFVLPDLFRHCKEEVR